MKREEVKMDRIPQVIFLGWGQHQHSALANTGDETHSKERSLCPMRKRNPKNSIIASSKKNIRSPNPLPFTHILPNNFKLFPYLESFVKYS
jgi:hypothetical protein